MSRKPVNKITTEAVRWFNRFRMKGPTALSPEEAEDWARWSANADNFAQFRRVKRIWKGLTVLARIPAPTRRDVEADQYDPSLSVADWLAKNKPPPKTKR